jgi:hypothetical protein
VSSVEPCADRAPTEEGNPGDYITEDLASLHLSSSGSLRLVERFCYANCFGKLEGYDKLADRNNTRGVRWR